MISRPGAFLRKTLDLSIVYLTLTGVALPFIVILRLLIRSTGEFFLAVALVGAVLALTVMPYLEKRISVFSKEKPAHEMQFSYASMTIRVQPNSTNYRIRAERLAQLRRRHRVWVIQDTEHCRIDSAGRPYLVRNQTQMSSELYHPAESAINAS